MCAVNVVLAKLFTCSQKCPVLGLFVGCCCLLLTVTLVSHNWPTVPLFVNARISNTQSKSIHSSKRQLCNFAFFRQATLANEHAMDMRWISSRPSEKLPYLYKPLVCSVSESLADTAMCFEKSGVRSILVLGDSNGDRYYRGLVQLLEAAQYRCVLQRQELSPENQMPDPRYYTVNTGISLSDIR